jgi:DNA-nicking Smr family endonuclease
MSDKRNLTDDDRGAWWDVAKNITPLLRRVTRSPKKTEKKSNSFAEENAVFLDAMDAGQRIKATPTGTQITDKSEDQKATSSASKPAAGLDWIETDQFSRGDKKRIKQGLLKPTRSLDLHGYTVARAEKTIPQFLAQAQRDTHQIVEIITGHGRFKAVDDGIEKGVLKRLLPTWLEKPINRHYIKRVMAAPYSRGGAIWIVLKND